MVGANIPRQPWTNPMPNAHETPTRIPMTSPARAQENACKRRGRAVATPCGRRAGRAEVGAVCRKRQKRPLKGQIVTFAATECRLE